jgi:hypothetical protein
MKASSLSFKTAVAAGLIGMSWGIYMAISEDRSTLPAHAHLNLLGWVSLFLFGVYYHLYPQLDSTRLALAQVGVWIVSTIVLIIGVAMVHSGRSAGGPLAGVSSVVVVADMALFAWLVMKAESAKGAAAN